jgi:transmembrane sensor
LKNQNEHINELIAKHHSDSLTDSEKNELLEWIDESNENNSYFHSMITTLELVLPKTQTAKALLSTKKKIKEKANNKFTLISVSVAAAVALLIGFFLSKPDAQENIRMYSTKDIGTKETLDGGTVASLNKDTYLTTSFDEETKTHHYYLDGEANFEMHRQKDEHIEVHVSDITIEDIGTVFNVDRKSNSIIEIYVSEGRVKCYGPIGSIEIAQGNTALYNKSTKTFELVPNTNINADAYSTKKFHFENAKLKDVINQINDVYHMDIQVDSAVENCELTVDFDNEQVSNILSIIKETLGLNEVKTNTEVTLTGGGCE